jgi:hypothetical protein
MEGKYDPEHARRLAQEINARDGIAKREQEIEAIESPLIRLLVKATFSAEKFGRNMGKTMDFVTPVEELMSTAKLKERLAGEANLGHQEANDLEQQYETLIGRARKARGDIDEMQKDTRAMALVTKALDGILALNELSEFETKYINGEGRDQGNA